MPVGRLLMMFLLLQCPAMLPLPWLMHARLLRPWLKHAKQSAADAVYAEQQSAARGPCRRTLATKPARPLVISAESSMACFTCSGVTGASPAAEKRRAAVPETCRMGSRHGEQACRAVFAHVLGFSSLARADRPRITPSHPRRQPQPLRPASVAPVAPAACPCCPAAAAVQFSLGRRAADLPEAPPCWCPRQSRSPHLARSP